jgi:hypothetical protein
MASFGKILIVDDSEGDRLLCYHTFRRLRLWELVVQLKDGDEAIEYLQRDRSAALISRKSGRGELDWAAVKLFETVRFSIQRGGQWLYVGALFLQDSAQLVQNFSVLRH